MFRHLKVGDKVTRLLGGADGVKMGLKVTEVTETTIVCGAWTFDTKTGAEIDDDLQWGPRYGGTGSFLVKT